MKDLKKESIFKLALLFIISILLVIPEKTFAQYGNLKGANEYQINIGFTEIGLIGSVYYGQTFDKKIKGLVGVGVNIGSVADITYTGIYLDVLGAYNLYTVGRGSFSVNTEIGFGLVLDMINDFESSTLEKTAYLNYGVIGGLEGEFKATRNLYFVLTGQGRYYIKKEFGNLRYQLLAGVRFKF